MAGKYKSVLEKHNEDKTHRVPTAEEEAIQPIYPEGYLFGAPGKAVASGFIGSGKNAAKAIQRNTKIGSKVPDPEAVAADRAVAETFAKTPAGKATYDALRKKAEQAAEVKDQQKFLMNAGRSANRSAGDIFGETGLAVGSQMAEERRNAAGDTYKKGGKVSSASKRADGCAQRGKTRGKMV